MLNFFIGGVLTLVLVNVIMIINEVSFISMLIKLIMVNILLFSLISFQFKYNYATTLMVFLVLFLAGFDLIMLIHFLVEKTK